MHDDVTVIDYSKRIKNIDFNMEVSELKSIDFKSPFGDYYTQMYSSSTEYAVSGYIDKIKYIPVFCVASMLSDHVTLDTLLRLRNNDRHIRDYSGRTPLMYAVSAGSIDNINLLSKIGYSFSETDVYGNSCLSYVICRSFNDNDSSALYNEKLTILKMFSSCTFKLDEINRVVSAVQSERPSEKRQMMLKILQNLNRPYRR